MERTGHQYGKPHIRIQQSYTREYKIKVLHWWTHEQILEGGSEGEGFDSNIRGVRLPFILDVSDRFLLPITTLHNWMKNEDKIVNGRKGERTSRGSGKYCQWPDLEQILYTRYQKRRQERKPVRRCWLSRQAHQAFQEAYPDQNSEEFTFSTGWFTGFLPRHDISLRFTTNKSQKIPDDYLNSILQWLQFNQRNSQIRPETGERLRDVGRYWLDSIVNMDETPLPFKFLDGQTYADRGSKSVQVKVTNSGWDKRQATLVLAVFGSGRQKIKPLIIFRGKKSYDGSRR